MAGFLKNRLILQSVIGSAIWQAVWSGISAIMGFTAAHFASVRGLPPHWAILIGAITFFLLALTYNLVVRRERIIKTATEIPNHNSSPNAAIERVETTGPQHVYANLNEAIPEITQACKEAETISILANKGIVFVGTDESIVSTAEMQSFKRLRKIRVILMSPNSRWITKGFISFRQHESFATYVGDLEASHRIVESAVRRFANKLQSSRTGVKYFTGEPCWRIVMTERVAFVSNYADDRSPQIRDIPVGRFDNVSSSFYSSFKRHFDNVWHNESNPGEFMQSTIDFSVSAGGIVYADNGGERVVLLLRRHDGSWILPKGHKKIEDKSLEDVALREVSEEAGIPARDLRVEEPLETYMDTTHEPKVVHLFAIRYLGRELPVVQLGADHAEACWWPVSSSGFPDMLYPYQATTLAEFTQASESNAKSGAPINR
ncbi:MAG: NUDIX hydrolase [Pyrinomonadaceae bacterium]